MSDAGLTDAMERALIALADYDDQHPGGWGKPARLNTLEALERRGYCTVRFVGWTELAQINQAGRELLASMGD